MSPTTPWTGIPLFFLLSFWALQFLSLLAHLILITSWIGFLGSKNPLPIFRYIHAILLLSYTIFTTILLTELNLHFRHRNTSSHAASSALSLPCYHKLQFIKIRILLAEMVALGVLCHGVGERLVWVVLVCTGVSRIPFKLSCIFAVLLKRKENQRLERESKETDEETSLLH